jgi:hypothetical protein
MTKVDRLSQIRKVRNLMSDGSWRTLAAIGRTIRIPVQSAGSRLRDLRMPDYGRFKVLRSRTDVPGVFIYKLAGKRRP